MACKQLLVASVGLFYQAAADFLEFQLLDSIDQPTSFKDGLASYIKVEMDGEDLEQFLLCTSCTVSYIFGTTTSTDDPVQMTFKDGADPVDVTFADVTLSLTDTFGVAHSWDMSIGYIDPSYQSSEYFDFYKENMLGLAPMYAADDSDGLLSRQFLYQFQSAAGLDNLSYGFLGSEYKFVVGASVEEYAAMQYETSDGDEDGTKLFGSTTVQVTDVIGDATTTTNKAPSLTDDNTDLMLKIQDYVPPMREELQLQNLVIDTWYRDTQLPHFFYDYFMDTFMIPAYTCDESDSLDYSGFSDVYTCYCNNGDYHTMPVINFEIEGHDYQYDMAPENYMFMPYIDYSVPMSRCILGLDETSQSELSNGNEYVSLGQRALTEFPFFAVFDFAGKSAQIQLGGSIDMGGKSALGVQIAISVIIVIILFLLLVYLIYLRRNRIKAEEWLEQHKNTLFSQTANLKTEEEILEALVKSKELKDLLEQRNTPASSALTAALPQQSSSNSGNNSGLLSNDNESNASGSFSQKRKKSSSNASGSSDARLLPTKKFSNDPSGEQ